MNGCPCWIGSLIAVLAACLWHPGVDSGMAPESFVACHGISRTSRIATPRPRSHDLGVGPAAVVEELGAPLLLSFRSGFGFPPSRLPIVAASEDQGRPSLSSKRRSSAGCSG